MSETRGKCGKCQGGVYHDGLNWRHDANHKHLGQCPEGKYPTSDQMLAAADVMDAVNERYRNENPTAGFSANEPISPSSMRFLADHWSVGQVLTKPQEGEQ